jgi:predicted dinucleotide-binding enzyme
VASLLHDLDLDPVDAAPLTSARYIEPAGMLCIQLAYGMGMGPKLAMKPLRDRADAELSYV